MMASREGEKGRNAFVRLWIRHWTTTPKAKTPAEEERERYLFLFWKILPFNRWMLFASALLIQFCCGALYAWSNFNAPIDEHIYGTRTANRAPNTFYIAVGMFGMSAMAMGPYLERNGPRRGLLVGSVVYGIGQAVASFSLYKKSIAGLYFGYGVLGGFGLGVNYISPVSALQKFFPDLRGAAAGFAVAGFGAGSIVWSKTYLPMIDRFELPGTFAILGALFTFTMLASSIVMRTPPKGFVAGGLNIHGVRVGHPHSPPGSAESNSLTPSKVDFDGPGSGSKPERIDHDQLGSPLLQMSLVRCIRTPDFIFMYVMFFGNQIFGMVALSRLANMAQDLFGRTPTEGSNLVAINGVFNCTGRLLLPMATDLLIRFTPIDGPLARKQVFVLGLSFQVVVVALLPSLIADRNYAGFEAVMWLLTFVYGGGFGTIPCFLTDMFGPQNIGALHGIILTALGIGGVGGGLGFTAVFDEHKPPPEAGKVPFAGAFDEAYQSNFAWIRAVLIVGLVTLLFVRTSPEDRSAAGWRFSLFGVRVVHFGAKEKSTHPAESAGALPSNVGSNHV